MNKLTLIAMLLACCSAQALDIPDTIWMSSDSVVEDNYMRTSGFITANYGTVQSVYVTSVNTGYFGVDQTWIDTIAARSTAGWVITGAGVVLVADSVYTATRVMNYRVVLKPPYEETQFTGRDWDNSLGFGNELAWTTGLAANYSTINTGVNAQDGTGYDAGPVFDSVEITEYTEFFTDTIPVPAEYVQDCYDNGRGWGITAKQSVSGGTVYWYSHENTASSDYNPKFFVVMSNPLDVYGYEEINIGTGGIEATGIYSLTPTNNYASTNPLSLVKSAFPQTDVMLIRPVDFSHMTLTSGTVGACSLFVKGVASTPGNVNFHVCNQDWTEAGATYNTYDGSTSWSSSGGADSSGTDIGTAFDQIYLDAAQYYGVEVPLATAQAWLTAGSANGIMIRGVQTVIGTLNSDEVTAENAPYFRFYPLASSPERKRVIVFNQGMIDN